MVGRVEAERRARTEFSIVRFLLLYYQRAEERVESNKICNLIFSIQTKNKLSIKETIASHRNSLLEKYRHKCFTIYMFRD